MSGYILSPAAKADIDAIWDYTADTWSIEQADRYVGQIKRACGSISPDGREGRLIPDVREGYRKLAIGSHLIIFRLVRHGRCRPHPSSKDGHLISPPGLTMPPF